MSGGVRVSPYRWFQQAGLTLSASREGGVWPNKPLQRSGVDKVLGCGRGEVVLEQVLRAGVLKHTRPAAERGC